MMKKRTQETCTAHKQPTTKEIPEGYSAASLPTSKKHEISGRLAESWGLYSRVVLGAYKSKPAIEEPPKKEPPSEDKPPVKEPPPAEKPPVIEEPPPEDTTLVAETTDSS
jgi:hypothetical protein